VWVVATNVSHKPEPKKIDSLGRDRLPSERYSQGGGTNKPKHIVWRCKGCSRHWNLTSKSYRYDSKCRQCGIRNTILLTLPKTYVKSRKRVTQFEFFPDAETAEFVARKKNIVWMENRIKKQYRDSSFIKASMFNKLQGSIDSRGHHHPKNKHE